MAMNAAQLAVEIEALVDAKVTAAVGYQAKRSAAWQGVAEAIVEHIKNNLEVSTASTGNFQPGAAIVESEGTVE